MYSLRPWIIHPPGAKRVVVQLRTVCVSHVEQSPGDAGGAGPWAALENHRSRLGRVALLPRLESAESIFQPGLSAPNFSIVLSCVPGFSPLRLGLGDPGPQALPVSHRV